MFVDINVVVVVDVDSFVDVVVIILKSEVYVARVEAEVSLISVNRRIDANEVIGVHSITLRTHSLTGNDRLSPLDDRTHRSHGAKQSRPFTRVPAAAAMFSPASRHCDRAELLDLT